MPRVHPSTRESYLCTPVRYLSCSPVLSYLSSLSSPSFLSYLPSPARVDTDAAYSVTGFRPNATMMTAHHMLVYGCEEPGGRGHGGAGWVAGVEWWLGEEHGPYYGWVDDRPLPGLSGSG